MLFIKETPIDTILSMEEMIVAVEESLKETALGRGVDLPRRRIHHPNRMIFGLLPGSFQGAMGVYLQTDLDRRIHHESIMLYSVDTGEPLILFQDCSINELRTGAAGGIGAKYLAREDAGRVAVLGSSIHAETQLKAVCAVRSITHAKVFSPTPAHRLSFAEKVRRELNIEVRPVESPDEAMEEADILITATNSQKPVVDKSSLRGGMHITSIANGDKTRTRQEIDEAVIGHCAPLFITSKETVCVNESDIFRAVRNRVISWEQVYEIADLLLGKRPGRQSEKQITLYKLQGLGIMDVAIGFEAYKRLRGTSLVQTL